MAEEAPKTKINQPVATKWSTWFRSADVNVKAAWLIVLAVSPSHYELLLYAGPGLPEYWNPTREDFENYLADGTFVERVLPNLTK